MPGCSNTPSMFTQYLPNADFCSHSISHEYFTESIKDKNAFECLSDLLDRYNQMGWFAEKIVNRNEPNSSVLFDNIETNAEAPFSKDLID